MADNPIYIGKSSAIRTILPGASVCFEIELSAKPGWSSLQAGLAVLAAAGAVLNHLKVGSDGRIMCCLQDDIAFDPEALIMTLAESPVLRLERWTAMLCSEGSVC